MNPEWVDAGARAWVGAGGIGGGSMALYRLIVAVIAAVEPLIRADERRAARNANAIRGYMAGHEAEVRAQIAADIEAGTVVSWGHAPECRRGQRGMCSCPKVPMIDRAAAARIARGES